MSAIDWNVPKNEEGLQDVLTWIEQSRSNGDLVELGNGLLELSFLVKWVRSDTDTSPFERAQELSVQALAVFREANHANGILRALVSLLAMCGPDDRRFYLAEAEELANGLGDENSIAKVLAAKGRMLGLSDREQATKCHLQALEIYRRTGNQIGQAQCHFSLSIGMASSEEKLEFATEAARIYRELGLHDDAARCMMIAIMNAEEFSSSNELEELIKSGLADAYKASKQDLIGSFSSKLAKIYFDKGEITKASQAHQVAAEIGALDTRTPLEKWTFEVEMATSLVSMAKQQGNKEVAKMFRDELKRLRANKPSE